MKIEQLRKLLELAYLRGFEASGDGWNGEYPFNATDHRSWEIARDNTLTPILADAAAQDLVV